MINARLAVIQCHIKEQPNIAVAMMKCLESDPDLMTLMGEPYAKLVLKD